MSAAIQLVCAAVLVVVMTVAWAALSWYVVDVVADYFGIGE